MNIAAYYKLVWVYISYQTPPNIIIWSIYHYLTLILLYWNVYFIETVEAMLKLKIKPDGDEDESDLDLAWNLEDAWYGSGHCWEGFSWH